MRQLSETLDETEDAFSGVPKQNPPPPPNKNDGRMYPPLEDFTTHNPDGSLSARTRAHRIDITADGKVTITSLRTGQVEFHQAMSDVIARVTALISEVTAQLPRHHDRAQRLSVRGSASRRAQGRPCPGPGILLIGGLVRHRRTVLRRWARQQLPARRSGFRQCPRHAAAASGHRVTLIATPEGKPVRPGRSTLPGPPSTSRHSASVVAARPSWANRTNRARTRPAPHRRRAARPRCSSRSPGTHPATTPPDGGHDDGSPATPAWPPRPAAGISAATPRTPISLIPAGAGEPPGGLQPQPLTPLLLGGCVPATSAHTAYVGYTPATSRRHALSSTS